MLKSLQLNNWCQHHKEQIEFHPGFNAIVGPNGAGKSNLVGAILYALTGAVHGPGVKEDNVRRDRARGEVSGVELLMERDGLSGHVVRTIHPARQSFQAAGEKWVMADEVNAALETYLGTSRGVLTGYVFVPQWKVFSFVDERDGDRAKHFQKLFDMARFEKVHKALSGISLPQNNPEMELDSLRARVEERRLALDQSRKELDSFPDLTDDVTILPEYLLLDQARRYRDALRRQESCQAMVRVHEERLGKIQQKLEQLRQEINDLGEPEDTTQASLTLASLQQNRQRLERKAYLDNQIRLRSQRIGELEVPAGRELLEQEVAEHARQAQELRLQIDREKRLADSFRSGVASCPVCQTPTDNLRDRIQHAYDVLPKLREQAEGLELALRNSEQLKVYRTTREHEEEKILAIQEELFCLEGIEPVSPATISALQELVIRSQRTQQQLQRLQLELARQEGEEISLRRQLEQERNQLIQVEQQVEHLRVDELAEQEARNGLQEYQNILGRRAQLRAKVHYLSQALEEDLASVEKLKKDVRQAVKDRQVESRLQRLRDLFNWDALPRDLAEGYLNKALVEVNNLLALFDAPFRVKLGPSLRFLALRGDHEFSASRLSGGEKVLFALAFRIVINSMFAEDLGLIVLDEPTAGLDDDNIGCLDVAFRRFRQLTEANGLQVIVVTHERRLASLFDRVHELKPAV